MRVRVLKFLIEELVKFFINRNLKYPTQTGVRKIYIFFLLDRLGPTVGKVEEGRWLFLKQCRLWKCVEYIFN